MPEILGITEKRASYPAKQTILGCKIAGYSLASFKMVSSNDEPKVWRRDIMRITNCWPSVNFHYPVATNLRNRSSTALSWLTQIKVSHENDSVRAMIKEQDPISNFMPQLVVKYVDLQRQPRDFTVGLLGLNRHMVWCLKNHSTFLGCGCVRLRVGSNLVPILQPSQVLHSSLALSALREQQMLLPPSPLKNV